MTKRKASLAGGPPTNPNDRKRTAAAAGAARAEVRSNVVDSARSSPAPLRGRTCECIGCEIRFLNGRAFEAHRAGDHGVREGARRRRCMNEAELRGAGLFPDERGLWRLPARAYIGPRSLAGSRTSRVAA